MSTNRFFPKSSSSDNINTENDNTKRLQELKSEYDRLINEKHESRDQVAIVRIKEEVLSLNDALKLKREPLVDESNMLVKSLGPVIKRTNPYQIIIRKGNSVRLAKLFQPSLQYINETKVKLMPLRAQIDNLTQQIHLIEELFPNFIDHFLDSPSSRMTTKYS